MLATPGMNLKRVAAKLKVHRDTLARHVSKGRRDGYKTYKDFIKAHPHRTPVETH